MDTTIETTLIQVLATFLAALCATIPAIIALVFAARQLRELIRQNNQLDKSIKSSIYNDIISAEREVWQTILANDPALLRWWLKNVVGLDDSSDELINKQRLFVLHQLSFYENLYFHYSTGTFPPEAWPVWLYNMKVDINSEWYQAVWAKGGQWYMENFRKFMEEQIDPAARKSGRPAEPASKIATTQQRKRPPKTSGESMLSTLPTERGTGATIAIPAKRGPRKSTSNQGKE